MSVSQNFSTIDPSLRLNFQGARTLDPRITFERSSTGTYVDEDGLIKTAAVDQARFDYDPSTGESLGLLIEESRTNLITYSEDFSQSVWTKQNGFSITSNTAIAPDGTLTADTASRVNLSAEYLYQNLGLPAGTYTLSCWIKSVNASSSFSIASYSGVDGSQSSSFTATNTWKRFSHTVTVSSTVTGFYPCIPSVSGEQFYIWGAQVEQGFSSTSYIPTSGSTVTRSADTARITGNNFSSWYNQSEGSFIFNSKTFEQDGNNNYYGETGDGTSSNRNIMYSNANSGSGLYFYITNTTVYVSTLNSGYQYQLNTYVKIGYCYKENDFGVFAPGGLSNTDNGGLIHTANSFAIGTNNTSFSEHLNGHLKQVIYYPTRLTNAQLQSLTG